MGCGFHRSSRRTVPKIASSGMLDMSRMMNPTPEKAIDWNRMMRRNRPPSPIVSRMPTTRRMMLRVRSGSTWLAPSENCVVHEPSTAPAGLCWIATAEAPMPGAPG
jgi:hypothetical protein